MMRSNSESVDFKSSKIRACSSAPASFRTWYLLGNPTNTRARGLAGDGDVFGAGEGWQGFEADRILD
jgi:hypothetical protein